jgi:hypothetical protein
MKRKKVEERAKFIFNYIVEHGPRDSQDIDLHNAFMKKFPECIKEIESYETTDNVIKLGVKVKVNLYYQAVNFCIQSMMLEHKDGFLYPGKMFRG